MHPKNLHQGRYDFDLLCAAKPDLREHVHPNPSGDQTIDFSDAKAVLSLNAALLAHHYSVRHWDLPDGVLCPAIPGRADYIHYLADLVSESGDTLSGCRILDIGTGANCIYPIIGSQCYGWKFVGSEVNMSSLKTARAIVDANSNLKSRVRLVQQKDPSSIFRGIIKPSDRFAASLCNPPFHDSAEAAQAGSQRKVHNLNRGRAGKQTVNLNFGGQANELWCPGGEFTFISNMIGESVQYAQQVEWFTTLVSKRKHVQPLQARLQQAHAAQVKVIEMGQGQKISRILAWSFQSAPRD